MGKKSTRKNASLNYLFTKAYCLAHNYVTIDYTLISFCTFMRDINLPVIVRRNIVFILRISTWTIQLGPAD